MVLTGTAQPDKDFLRGFRVDERNRVISIRGQELLEGARLLARAGESKVAVVRRLGKPSSREQLTDDLGPAGPAYAYLLTYEYPAERLELQFSYIDDKMHDGDSCPATLSYLELTEVYRVKK